MSPAEGTCSAAPRAHYTRGYAAGNHNRETVSGIGPQRASQDRVRQRAGLQLVAVYDQSDRRIQDSKLWPFW